MTVCSLRIGFYYLRIQEPGWLLYVDTAYLSDNEMSRIFLAVPFVACGHADLPADSCANSTKPFLYPGIASQERGEWKYS
jgi:hypothetical protein